MKTEVFQKLLERRIGKIQETLSSKAKEYATEDQLHNFKVAARLQNTNQATALWSMSTKHLVSVIDMVDGVQVPTKHKIDEKIGDLINYLILLEAALIEEISE